MGDYFNGRIDGLHPSGKSSILLLPTGCQTLKLDKRVDVISEAKQDRGSKPLRSNPLINGLVLESIGCTS